MRISKPIFAEMTVGLGVAAGVVLFSGALPTERFHSLFLKSAIVSAVILIGFLLGTKDKKVDFSILPFLVIAVSALSLIVNNSTGGLQNLGAFVLITISAILAANTLSANKLAFSILLGIDAIVCWTVTDAFLLDPSTGIQKVSHALLGIFHNENILGLSILIGIPMSLGLLTQSLKMTLFKWISFTLVFATIIASTSQTALFSAMIALALWCLFQALKHSRKLFVILTGLLLLVGVFLLSNSQLILKMIGKNSTFSGRTRVWEAALNAISERPFWGFGWDTIIDPSSELNARISQITGWKWFAHLHNDLLQWFATAGLLAGIGILLMYFLTFMFSGYKLWRFQKQEYLWIFLAICTLAIQGLSEISSFRPQGWLIVNILLVALVKLMSSHKLANSPSSMLSTKYLLMKVSVLLHPNSAP